MTIGWIDADWPAPAGIVAGTTTRAGGVSKLAYESLNVGQHVGDDPGAVAENRRRVVDHLALEQAPFWLDQQHGIHVADAEPGGATPAADAAVTSRAGMPLVIMTADCLPILLASRDGSHIGAAHGGWRGLADGIVFRTLAALPVASSELIAWLGPAISLPAFEVGGEVRDAFVARYDGLDACFVPNGRGRFQADLYGIARRQLAAAGVEDVYGGDHCTCTDEARFFSYRRDGVCGRMASIVCRRA